MRSIPSFRVLALAVAVSACADHPAPVSGPELEPMLAREPVNPNALWELNGALSDGTPAGITGDGLNAGATGPASNSTGAYQGGVCGVRTAIFVNASRSGDATIDPDAEWSSGRKCPRRFFNLAVGSGVVRGGPFTNARNVWYDAALQAIGGSKLERMQWWVEFPECDRIRFENVRITRQADVGTKRSWTVESTEHTAVCLIWNGGSYIVNTSQTHYLPFSLRITES